MITRGTAGGREPVGLFFAIDLVVHLLLNGTSLVTRDGAEDAHVRTPLSVYRCCTAVAVVHTAANTVVQQPLGVPIIRAKRVSNSHLGYTAI